MRNTRREKPHVAFGNVVHEGFARFVHAGYAHAAVEHQRPLAFLVPVQLAVRVGRETHVGACHGGRDGQLVGVLGARPAGAREAVAVVG